MPKRSIAVLGALLTMVLATGVVLASHQFPDVTNSNIFHDDIAWLNDNGITQVAEGKNWKPKDPVLREQMAAFLHRYDDNLGSAETFVGSLAAPFQTSGTLVELTPDGVAFGPYGNGGAAGGSVCFLGVAGAQLADLANLAYYARYVSDGDTGGVGVPYLRVFTEGAGADPDHSSIFSPNTQSPDADVAEGPFHEWVATSGSWRYDDDAGNGPDMSYEDLIDAHGDEIVTKLCISTGNTAGTDLAALLRWLEINGERLVFRG